MRTQTNFLDLLPVVPPPNPGWRVKANDLDPYDYSRIGVARCLKRLFTQESPRHYQPMTSIAVDTHYFMRGPLPAVLSYGWYPLVVFDRATETAYVNTDRYSITTTIQQRTVAHVLHDLGFVDTGDTLEGGRRYSAFHVYKPAAQCRTDWGIAA